MVLGIHIWFLINKRFHRWCNTNYDNVCIHYKSDSAISSGRMLNAYCIESNVNHIRSRIWLENSLMGYQGINWMMKYRLPNTFSGVEFQSKYCLMANRFISDLSLSSTLLQSVCACELWNCYRRAIWENNPNGNLNCKYANYAYSSFGLLIFYGCAQMRIGFHNPHWNTVAIMERAHTHTHTLSI